MRYLKRFALCKRTSVSIVQIYCIHVRAFNNKLPKKWKHITEPNNLDKLTFIALKLSKRIFKNHKSYTRYCMKHASLKVSKMYINFGWTPIDQSMLLVYPSPHFCFVSFYKNVGFFLCRCYTCNRFSIPFKIKIKKKICRHVSFKK